MAFKDLAFDKKKFEQTQDNFALFAVVVIMDENAV